MSQEYQLPRGTLDFLPDIAEKTAYVEYMLKSISSLYGYREIRTPIFEHTNLFLRSVGESSDIVNKEMYTFFDKGNRSITLRPEGTAGVIRAFVENKIFADPDLPVKYFYHGPIFRYERPGAGRYRQINQFGYECIGIKNPLLDAELVLMISSTLYMMGLRDFTVKINSLGDIKSRENYKNALKDYFRPHIEDFCDDCKRRFEQNTLRILDCKVDCEKEILKKAPKINDYLSSESKKFFEDFALVLSKYDVPYEIDYNLVRGLDYYSEVVFEIIAKTKDGKDYGAIGGGGRYDDLIKELGGPDMSAIGVAFGVERLVLLLDSYGLFNERNAHLEAYVMPLDNASLNYSLDIVTYLRSNGFHAEMDYQCRSLRAQFKTIERQKIPFAILIGENEVKNQQVTIKNTESKEQTTINANETVQYLEKALRKLMEEKQKKSHDGCSCGNHGEDHGCCGGDCGDECNCNHGEECSCGNNETEEHSCCNNHHKK